MPGDVVILAGKGHERSMIYGAEKRPWHEANVAREVLRALGYHRSETNDTEAR
jgi:UDP-N-acetylmuramoyl-L-alanyl-D-glutamate--2,6-diaminopimelate ligase